MVHSEIKTFSNENEFVAIVATLTNNDYFVVGAENTIICICNNSFMNCDNEQIYSLNELWQIAKGTNDICIERNYFKD